MIDIMVTDLPQPLSPTTASVSPCVQVERDAIDRVYCAFGDVKAGAQIFDFKKLVFPAP